MVVSNMRTGKQRAVPNFESGMRLAPDKSAMADAFVLINEPVHRLLRKLTREVPLTRASLPEGGFRMQYQANADSLTEDYCRLATFHALHGMPLQAINDPGLNASVGQNSWLLQQAGFFDAVRLDRRCSRDLRLKLGRNGPAMVAGELLTYGSGTLRARNDDRGDRLQSWLWNRYGRLQTRHEAVFARIGALHWNCARGELCKEHFDSTNLIFGDAYGEIEQLWERRADTDFLEEAAQDLQQLHQEREFAALVQPPRNLPAILDLHLRAQAIWRRPPASARSLLRRIEYILSHTFIENAPETVLVGANLISLQSGSAQPANAEWQADNSGYDGWLNDD